MKAKTSMRRAGSFAAAIVLATILTLPLAAQNFAVKTYQLKNGMRILVQEDHSIPNVALYIFYRVGSRNEHSGATGLSHFFEHMMFNGAKKYGPQEFDRVMEAGGGSNNAYTSQNVTVYQDWFPTSQLDLIFDLEADRIANLSFDPKMIASERNVVASERRTSVDANNIGLLSEQLYAAAFLAHPYHWPVVGWMADIENWTSEDLHRHFEMGYAPNNATMVVAGDSSGNKIFQLARKYIEPISARTPPPKVMTIEPEQLGERRITVKKFAQLPLLMIGYHIPETSNPDYYPLQVLSAILFSGESSRMYRRLVDKDQIAIAVDGAQELTFDPGLYVITAQPNAGVPPDRVEKAIYDELGKLLREPVSDQELAKAKNILLAAFYRDMKTINGRANLLGSYDVFFGDYRKLFTAAEKYNKVTKDDLQRVVKKYFTEKNRTVATLVPDASSPEPAAPAKTGK